MKCGKHFRRREFLEASAAAALLLMRLPRTARAAPPTRRVLPWRNWSGLQGCAPQARLVPASEDELLARLPGVEAPVRPVGAGHSFSALVPTQGTLVSLDRLAGVIACNTDALQAEVWAGTRLGALGAELADCGQASENLPDIDAQALGGVLATATHGTGDRFGALPTQVVSLQLATPGGQLIECDAEHNPELFQAARVGLGALGLVTRVKLQNRKPFHLRERSWLQDREELLAQLNVLRARNRHFQLWVLPHSELALAITSNETSDPLTTAPEQDPELLRRIGQLYDWTHWAPVGGDLLYATALRLIAGETERVGESRAIFAHANAVRFNEMEYHLPAAAGPDCLREVLTMIRREFPDVSFPLEYRYVAGDDLWLSPFYARESCSIAVHQFHDREHSAYFQRIEPIFWKYEGRPHWGKLHSLDAERLASRYPRWRDFQGVREELDPEGRFLNDHLRRLFGVAG